MPEEQEHKETAVVDADADSDKLLEEGLDKYEGSEETTEESSPSKETKEPETEETEDAGADQHKKAESEESKEEGEESGKELDPVTQKFSDRWNKAKEGLTAEHQKQMDELRAGMPSKEEIEAFKKTTSSAAYIRASMKSDGYTDTAIDARLKSEGHTVPTRGVDDVALVLKELNYDPASLTDQDKTYVRDVAKIARVITKNMLSQELPSHIDPVKKEMESIAGERESNQIFGDIESQVKEEGILDYKKDIFPELDKWTLENEKNPDVRKEDFIKFFNDLNHRLSIERLRTGKRKEGREEIKGKQRGNNKTEVINKPAGKMPERTGNFEDDLDSGADALFPE